MNIHAINNGMNGFPSPEIHDDFFDKDPDLHPVREEMRVLSVRLNKNRTTYIADVIIPGQHPGNINYRIENHKLIIRVSDEIVEGYEYHKESGFPCCYIEHVSLPSDAGNSVVECRFSSGILSLRIPRKIE